MSRQAIQTRYLLGKLTDAESASLEERSFVDDDVFDEIEIAEDELIDAYIGGSLSAEDRERFEKKLLQSGRIAERVEFARSLSESRSSHVMVQEPAKKSWWSGFFDISFSPNPALNGAVIGVLLLGVLGVPVFVWMQMRSANRFDAERAAIEQQKQTLADQLAAQQATTKQLETRLQDSKAQEEQLRRQLQDTREQLAAQEQLAKNNQQPILPAAISLLPRSLRGPGEIPELSVSPTAKTILLRLVLDTEENYNAYSARIESSVNDNLLTREGLKATRSGGSRIINFSFPAKDLPPGEYLIKLSGRTPSGPYEPVGDYRVRVKK